MLWTEPWRSTRGFHLMLNRLYPLSRLRSSRPIGRNSQVSRCLDSRTRGRATAAKSNRPGMEWLEARQLFAVSPSPVTLLQPYNGQQLSQTPQNLVIAFNGLNVPLLMGYLDVQIEELNHDGTKTPLWNLTDAPNEESDPTGTELIVPIQEFDTGTFTYVNLNLAPGLYEVDLAANSGLSYAASGAYGPGPQLWDPTQDHEIGTFTILGQGADPRLGDSSRSDRLDGRDRVGHARSRRSAECGRSLRVHIAGGASLSSGVGRLRIASAARSCRRSRSWIQTATSWRRAARAPDFRVIPMILIFSPAWNQARTTWGFPGLGNLAKAPGGYDPISAFRDRAGFSSRAGRLHLRSA